MDYAAPGAAGVPQPPPLPAPRPLQRAREAAFRFMGYQSRQIDALDSESIDQLAQVSYTARYAALSATQNATASHKTGLEINTLAINEKGTHAILGGKEIFKTIKIDNGKCTEELNLRAAIRSTPTHASGQPRQNYSIDVADVAWSRGDCRDYVAAATSSGKIILYDLGHAGLQAAQLHEHYRQVHKVTFNPHRGNLLLSGSQDGTVRLWDIRDARSHASTLQSKRKYSGQSDGVRDVKWSPTEGVDFAFGTDSGWIQRWDIRNLKAAKVKIPAHGLACNTIDWHQDGKHILSAGLDQMVRFWDFSTNRKQKPNWEIKTPYPVMNARWRPPTESGIRQFQGTRIGTQIVTSYDRGHSIIHVWDLRRSHLPFREILPYPTAPTDLAWHSQDLLWTVGREGVFLQTDIQHAPKVIDKRNMQALTISSTGEMHFATRRRGQKRSPRTFDPPPAVQLTRQGSSSLSISPEQSILSRSWADDSLDGSFLSLHPSKGPVVQSIIHKTGASASSNNPTLKLDEVLLRRISFRPQQSTVRGDVPTISSKQVFRYLAKHCFVSSLSTKFDDATDLFRTLSANGFAAEIVGLPKLGQTWEIIHFVVEQHISDRLRLRRERKLISEARLSKQSSRAQIGLFAKKVLADFAKSPSHTPSSMRPISAIAQKLGIVESTSNVPTPLARPVSSGRGGHAHGQTPLPDPEADEILTLPPSLASNAMLSFRPKPPANHPLTIDNLQDLHKQQSMPTRANRLDMVRKWSVQSRIPLNLDPVDDEGQPVRPKLLKHDSDESFAFLGDSSDSRGPSMPGSFNSGIDGPLDMVSDRPSRHGQSAPIPMTTLEIGREEEPALIPSPPASEREVMYDRHLDSASPKQVNRRRRDSAKRRSCTQPLDPDSDDERFDCEEGKPFTLLEMLKELINHHTTKYADAQIATQLIMLLLPLLPPTNTLPQLDIERTISVFAETYANLGLLPTDVEALVDQHLAHVVSAGLDPLQIEAIIATYHDQLMTHRLHVESTRLRQLCYPVFPSLWESCVKDITIHFACGTCHKPVSPGSYGDVMRCSHCPSERIAVCPICSCRHAPHGQSRRFSCCLLCGHGGHATCLEAWFAIGQGACPSEGCLCDCTKGPWRDAMARMAQRQASKDARRHHFRVRSDEWRVAESHAVSAVGSAALGGGGVQIVADTRASA